MRKALIVAAVVGLATVGGSNASAQFSFSSGGSSFGLFSGGSGISPIFGQPVTEIPRTGAFSGFAPPSSNRRNLLNRADNVFFGAFGISRISNVFGF